MPGMDGTYPAPGKAKAGGYPATVARLPKSLSRAAVDRSRLSREELNEQQRRRIVASLTEVFAKRGYQAATVDHLIATAKISMGSFYDHFESKEDCLLQIYDRATAAARARMAAAVPSDGDWVDRAYAGMYALSSFVVEEPMAARVVLLEAQTAGPESVRRYNDELRDVADFLRKGRAISAFEGHLPPTFEDATASGLAWLLQSRLARGEVGDTEALFSEMAEVALEPYLGTKKTRQSLAAFTSTAT
jgi:AcrR family transcriptional regulator